MITGVESAILLEVPSAEPLVGPLRAVGDVSASLGVPAHVTLLYPFADDPDPGVVEELRFFFSHVAGFDLDFVAVGEFPEVVWLAPNQSAVVSDLIASLARRWPSYPPYEGIFEEVVPHLTVVDTPDAALRARAAAEVLPGLPVHAAVTEASLWVHAEDGPWTRLAVFPLAPAES
ncbi:MAG: LigT-like protein [Frankiales bacterium]|nr:LigT-like protein [Frankiales bacterium]